LQENNLALLPDNILAIKHKDVNVNIDGDIVSLSDLEKIFFLTKLNPDPSFIANILKIDVIKIERIIRSSNFQQTINNYLSEYINKNVGEGTNELTLRYSDLLKECFISIRTSIGLRIRKAIEEDKLLDVKYLNIPIVEKLMKLEFALHGLPIDLKGVVVGHKKSGDKSNDELADSLKDIQDTLSNFKDKTFEPKRFVVKEDGDNGGVDINGVDGAVDDIVNGVD